MYIDENKLNKLTKLARIEIKEEEKVNILDLLNKDMAEIKEVFSVDTEGLEGLANPYEITLELYKDEVSDGNIRDEVLVNAPKELYGYFAVPKIIEG